MANRVYYVPQISLPQAVRFADCIPQVVTSDFNLALAYFLQNYVPRSAWRQWQKGPFPPPFLLQSTVNGTTVSYTIFFNGFAGTACPQFDCNLLCTTQDITLTQGGNPVTSTTFCINGERPIYHFDVEFSSEGDILALPATFQFVFTDSLNNTNTLTVDSIRNMKPAPPLVGSETDNSNAVKCYIGVIFQSHTFRTFENKGIEQFIVQRCDWPSKTNVRTFTGYWNIPARDNMFIDTDMSIGHEVAYRVKFKNKWGEESLFSEWVTGNR